MSGFTTMPIQIFNWASRPQAEFREVASAAIIVLLGLLLAMNAVAIIIRNRFQKRW
jgi:phosphate transport system permease protein